MNFLIFIFGIAFGLVLSRSGAADYNYIQNMFLFRDFQHYGIIGSAVVFMSLGIWVIRKRGKTLGGEDVIITLKPSHRGNIFGGVLFGIGWSITGMCPGPIRVALGLPPIEEGTGCG